MIHQVIQQQLQLVPRLVETHFTILMKNVKTETQEQMMDAQQVAKLNLDGLVLTLERLQFVLLFVETELLFLLKYAIIKILYQETDVILYAQ